MPRPVLGPADPSLSLACHPSGYCNGDEYLVAENKLNRVLGHLEQSHKCPEPQMSRVNGVNILAVLGKGLRGLAQSPNQTQSGLPEGPS